MEEGHIETDLPMVAKGTRQEDPASEMIGEIITDVPLLLPSHTTPHLEKAEKADQGMVSKLQSLPLPAQGNHMDQESHRGSLLVPGGQ